MKRPVVISALGVTQILAWGSSYYLLSVLAEPIARDTRWPLAWIVGGLSLGLLAAALISPRVGRLIDRHGGRPVLAFSACALGIGQIGLAMAPSLPVYLAAWVIIGLGMGAGLYDAAFATLGRLYGREARAAITTLTLFGGFASTVCWPLSAFFVSTIGWRHACLAYAAIQVFVAIPIYLLCIPAPPASPVTQSAGAETLAGSSGKAPALLFMILAASLSLATTISSLMSVHLLTILQAGGLALAAAVGLGALVGPSQVGARAIEMAISRYHHPIWTKVASVSFVAIGTVGLWAGIPLLPAALAFYGAGVGLESIARGTLPLALFGAAGYATLMGRLAMPSLIAQAGAPWIGALLLEHTSARSTLAVVASVALVNILLTIGLGWMVFRHRVAVSKS